MQKVRRNKVHQQHRRGAIRVRTPRAPVAIPDRKEEESVTAAEESVLPAVEESAEESTAREVQREPAAQVEQVVDSDHTAFRMYLREIGEIKLLTPQDEIVLAARIKKGDKKAREQMIKANLRLVVKIARDYEGYGVPLLDLISEGNIGLMKAVERFDPAKGAKFSTYSAWWIKQAIRRALSNQSKTIRLPVHVTDKLLHIRRAEAKLHQSLGREPSEEEVAQELRIDVRQVKLYRKASIAPKSLDSPLGDEDSNRVADVVADQNASTPYEQLRGDTETQMVREMVNTLDPRERAILQHRFGLDGEPEKTLEEVGTKFGVTRERIRQIQEIALRKLRKKIDQLEAAKIAA